MAVMLSTACCAVRNVQLKGRSYATPSSEYVHTKACRHAPIGGGLHVPRTVQLPVA